MSESILHNPLWQFSHIKYNKYQFSETHKEYLYNNYPLIKPLTFKATSKGNNVEYPLDNACIDIVIFGENISVKDIKTITIYNKNISVYKIDRESIQIHNTTHYGELSDMIILPNVLAKKGSKLHIAFKPGTTEAINKRLSKIACNMLTGNVYGIVLEYIGAVDICFKIMYKPININALNDVYSYVSKIFNVIKGDVPGTEFTMVIPSYLIKSKRINFAFYKNDNIVPALDTLLVYVNGNMTSFAAEELDIYQELTKYKMSKPAEPAILMSRNLLKDSKYMLVYSVDLVDVITNVVYIDSITEDRYNGKQLRFDTTVASDYDDFMMEVPSDNSTSSNSTSNYSYSQIYGCPPGGYPDDVFVNDIVLKFCTKPINGMKLYLRC